MFKCPAIPVSGARYIAGIRAGIDYGNGHVARRTSLPVIVIQRVYKLNSKPLACFFQGK